MDKAPDTKEQESVSADGDPDREPRSKAVYYPDESMPFARTIPEQYERFAQIREDICLDYGYNTARAYWGDLDDLFYWAIERNKDPLGLSDKDIRQYVALLRRRKYTENTIRRKMVVVRKLRERLAL